MQEALKEFRLNTNQSGLLTVSLFITLLCLVFVGFAQLTLIHWLWLIPFMGWVQYYVVISGHEAVHKTLCPNQQINDFIGVFGQAMVGVNFTAYRLQHMDHHRAPTNETDPDAHIYMGVLERKPGIQRFLWLTLGTFIEIIIKIRQKGVEGYGTERSVKPELSKKMRRDSIIVILMQLIIMFIAWNLLRSSLLYETFLESKEGMFWMITLGLQLVLSYAIVWTIPLFCITVFLNRCRIVIEHGLGKILANEQPKFNGPRIPTAEVVPTTVERWIFAPFNFNYHCSHHAFMTIPHYNLKDLHRYLFEHYSNDGNKYGLIAVKGGYLRALWTVVNHPVVWK